jgi:acetylornithine deacetylase
MRFLQGQFAGVAEAALTPVPDSVQQDPEYSFPLDGHTYADQPNLRLRSPGSGGGRSLIINTHLDVVPPSPGQPEPFQARIEDGVVSGRGACDCKGQIAMLHLALGALRDLGVPLRGDVIGHIVIEEECGGNGTLAFVRGSDRADAAIVLEPSDLRILPSVRGAVWFAARVYGRAGHSGQAGRTVSALKEAIRAIELLEGYHDRLLAASKGHPLYDRYPNPMPITFGMMAAGDWPAMAPNWAEFKGVLGFLPNRTREQVMAQMQQVLRAEGGEWLPEHFEMRFIYRHDCSEVPTGHPLVQALEAACAGSGHAPDIAAMPASCDACFYTNLIGVPAVVFGAGTLGVAHSAQEHIPIEQLILGARILARTIAAWCG